MIPMGSTFFPHILHLTFDVNIVVISWGLIPIRSWQLRRISQTIISNIFMTVSWSSPSCPRKILQSSFVHARWLNWQAPSWQTTFHARSIPVCPVSNETAPFLYLPCSRPELDTSGWTTPLTDPPILLVLSSAPVPLQDEYAPESLSSCFSSSSFQRVRRWTRDTLQTQRRKYRVSWT